MVVMSGWWTCPLCFDRMVESVDVRMVERDRDAHLRKEHDGATVEARLLVVSWWSVRGQQEQVRV